MPQKIKTTTAQKLILTAFILLITYSADAQIKKPADTIKTDTVQNAPYKLKEVNIKGYRNTKMDSLYNRKQFENIFKHKAPGLSSLLSNKVSYNNQYSPFQQSTSSIAGINLLALPALFTKKTNPTSKLQRQLLKDEQTGYISKTFSKTLISTITHLQGDSLQQFQERYTPTYTQAKQMSAYQMIIYIKNSLKDFKKPKAQ
ncbi:MAG TPA: hypothetical protein VK541_20495 [Pedobacter sp.]|uniref:hypothetical protein n=1 Tax=Pedobacter sp. TaxID=1411316 RepID=UPI002B615992|nr:hypothetical protein [Pedobacter sp.]HMI04880.1 hypothetical protein [Pedobacter sp.]